MRWPTPTRWPITARVLLIVLISVLTVQLANFALLEFAPLPGPPSASIGRVAAVLRGDRFSPAEFLVETRAFPIAMGEGRALNQGATLAKELGVGKDQIRLDFVDPPMIWAGRQRTGPPESHRLATRDTMMVGDFTAALRLPDGHWRTVQPVHSGMGAWRVRMIFWLLTAIVTAAPFAWLLARWLMRPVTLFAEAARRIGHDPRTAPMPIEGPHEIVSAAQAMNDMQERLNRYVDERTMLIGAIAHDLRTPLMRLTLRLENVPDALRAGVDRDIAEMQAMITATANYVRGATAVSTRRRVDVRSLAESIVDDHADRGANAILLPGAPVVIKGDPLGLKTMIDNLVGNALRYAGDAKVFVGAIGNTVLIEVRDHGPGVAEEDMAHIFEPFFRGERSRNRDTGGMGLGLASVRNVAERHGGEAIVRNHPDGGLSVQVTLPVAT